MPTMRKHWLTILIAILTLIAFSGCRPQAAEEADELPTLSPVSLTTGERLRVVATTSIVADVAQNVGGEWIELTTLLPLGADPHTYQPTPQDAAAIANAHVVLANGAGLEVFLEPLLESSGATGRVVPVSYGIDLLHMEADEHEHEDEEHEHGQFDPHVWFDPLNVIVWTENIAWALSTLDPAHAADYQANAASYQAELRALDAWIADQVALIPAGHRTLVSDHASFGYFAHRYGLIQGGTIIASFSTMAAPSAQELAALEESITALGVPAIFVGTTVNPALGERIARDTGTRLVLLYTGSLSAPGGPADSYLALMRYDTTAIVEALR